MVNTGISGEQYEISWSIPKAKELIEKEKVEPIEIILEDVYSDYNNLELEKLRFYEGQSIEAYEPIIVTYYSPINRLIAIDGNHRHYLAHTSGRKHIKAYLLSPYANTFMMNERNFKIYSFHHNLVCLSRLCLNPLMWRFFTDQSLRNNSYYGEVQFENLFFKKIKMLLRKPYLPKPQ